MRPDSSYSRAGNFRGFIVPRFQVCTLNSAVAKLCCAFLLAILPLCSQMSIAQTGAGEITGTVRDSTGAVVPEAKIVVKSVNTGLVRQATTNRSGIFTFSSLRPDKYNISIEAPAFQKISRT